MGLGMCILAMKCLGSLDQTVGERGVVFLSIPFHQQTSGGDGGSTEINIEPT